MKGTVKWYNSRKGYGFIEDKDGKDIFVHNTSLQLETRLDEGDEVEYDVESSDKGPKAVNVRKL
jgi:CspA family cold shock protein